MKERQLIRDLTGDASSVKFTLYMPGSKTALAEGEVLRRKKLEAMLTHGRTLLRRGLDTKAADEFLRPVEDVLLERGTLSQLRGSFAVYKGSSQLRVLSVPVEVPHLCVVADTFHVKPVLKWLQTAQEFQVVLFHRDGVSLFSADDRAYQHRGTIHCPDLMAIWVGPRAEKHSVGRGIRAGIFSVLEWIRTELHMMPQALDKGRPARLFLAGPRAVTDLVRSLAPPRWFDREAIGGQFTRDDLPQVLAGVRAVLRKREERRLIQKVAEFETARILGHTRSNLQRIADAALKGQIRRLFVASDEILWGRLDRRTGGLILSATQQDHRDDDVLDDLAEMVLRRGGDVVVEEKMRLPDQRAISAVVEPGPRELGVVQWAGVQASAS